MSHMNESYHIFMSHGMWMLQRQSCHIWMSHVPCAWVMSHMNGLCQQEWAMAMWMHHFLFLFFIKIPDMPQSRRKKTILRLLNVDSHCVCVCRRGETAPSVVYSSASPGHARMCMCVCVWMRKGLDATWGNTCTYVCEREREREREMEQSRKDLDYN